MISPELLPTCILFIWDLLLWNNLREVGSKQAFTSRVLKFKDSPIVYSFTQIRWWYIINIMCLCMEMIAVLWTKQRNVDKISLRCIMLQRMNCYNEVILVSLQWITRRYGCHTSFHPHPQPPTIIYSYASFAPRLPWGHHSRCNLSKWCYLDLYNVKHVQIHMCSCSPHLHKHKNSTHMKPWIYQVIIQYHVFLPVVTFASSVLLSFIFLACFTSFFKIHLKFYNSSN